MRFIADQEGGVGVPELLADLVSVGVDDATVRARLTHLGWMPPQDEPQSRYTVVESLAWPVDDAFPRIVAGSFKAGTVPDKIGQVVYWVDLSQPPPMPLSTQEFETHLTRLIP
jgi:hypothetical protein